MSPDGAGPPVIGLDDPAGARPGGVLTGEVRWRLAAAPERGEVRILWFTGAGRAPDVQVVEAVDLSTLPRSRSAPVDGGPYRGVSLAPAAGGPLEARDARSFRFRLPESPVSFTGSLVSVSWAVELELWPGPVIRRGFVLAPGGTPIRLPADPTD